MAKDTSTKITVAIGVASAAAAAAGAYWLYGAKHNEKHRKMASSWMLKARAEVVDAVAKMGSIDKASYAKIVNDIVQKYAAKHHSAADIAKVTKEMNTAWTHIQAAAKPAKRAAKKLTSKVASKKK